MLSESVLVDAGPLIALFNVNDPSHDKWTATAELLPVGKAYTCWPVIVEAAYLLRPYPEERCRLLEAVGAEEFVLLPLGRGDVPGIRRIIEKYHDQDLDLADAALAHLADREGIGTVFTLDKRHFHVLRRADGNAFRLLPD